MSKLNQDDEKTTIKPDVETITFTYREGGYYCNHSGDQNGSYVRLSDYERVKEQQMPYKIHFDLLRHSLFGDDDQRSFKAVASAVLAMQSELSSLRRQLDEAEQSRDTELKRLERFGKRVVDLEAQVTELKRQLTIAQDNNHRRNLELDALHYVWCDGGCNGGVHRWHKEPITKEVVETAIASVKRLVSWWNSAQGKQSNYFNEPTYRHLLSPFNQVLAEQISSLTQTNERLQAILKDHPYYAGKTDDALECIGCEWKGYEQDAIAKYDEVEGTQYWCPNCKEICAHLPIDELDITHEEYERMEKEVKKANAVACMYADNTDSILTRHILMKWDRDKLERFSLHLLGDDYQTIAAERDEAKREREEFAKAIFDEITTASNEAMQGWMRPVMHTDDVVLAILEKKGYVETRYREYGTIYRWKQEVSE